MESKNQKYLSVKRHIEAGDITTVRHIFNYIAKSRVAQDLGIHYDRIKLLIDQDEKWILEDLYQLAAFIGIEERVILDLIYNQRKEKKTKRTKKS